MSEVIQVGGRYPYFASDEEASGIFDSILYRLKQTFYDELDKHLAKTPGGVILGPVTVKHRTEDDWLFGTGQYVTFNISATCQDLPEPPMYRLIGGPADGRIVRTRGERLWLVPQMPPIPSAVSYTDLSTGSWPQLVAEYERQGDTAAYFYRRTYERP